MNRKKVVNIVNFIRGEDPRVEQQVLYDTFKNQVELCKKYPMPYTFLMQYDAMVRPEYAKLLIENDDPNMEIGIWIEMAQEQVERVGIQWNGRPGFKWDWHVNPDMLMAYTLPQRELLIDEFMNRFKEIFGYFPKSAGSWLIDTHSIIYLKEKYGVESICICREQFGTDGYTLWGGYYNQGYYPSRKNMLMPAQTKAEQVDVPVFRMLGPDPIYQYDCTLDEHFNGSSWQNGVMSLEPGWPCGQSEEWVDWFLHSNFEEEFMSFSYTQAGQENPFTWSCFGKALEMQMEKLYEGYVQGRWEVLTLLDTGRWFSNTYSMTPATAFTALTDWKGDGKQSVWYNCKNYRVNWYRRDGKVCIRDIFIFDEHHPERYWDDIATGPSAVYDTLPIVDGYRWGGNDIHSALYFVRPNSDEKLNSVIEHVVSESDTVLKLEFTVDGEKVVCHCGEDGITIECSETPFEMRLEYLCLQDTDIKAVTDTAVTYLHDTAEYGMTVSGKVHGERNIIRLIPIDNKLHIRFF